MTALKDKDIVECTEHYEYPISISMLFGKSPKVEYFCEKCKMYNSGRMDMINVNNGKPYLRCKYCQTLNSIQLRK